MVDMKKYLFILCLLSSPILFAQDWQKSFDEAQVEASNHDKTIFLVFSGSDWCAPCIKLNRKVWMTGVFRTYAQSNFALYKADFPRKKINRLPNPVAAENAALAERYNPDGYFPLVLLLDKEGSVIGKTGYRQGGPEAYVEHLNSLLQ